MFLMGSHMLLDGSGSVGCWLQFISICLTGCLGEWSSLPDENILSVCVTALAIAISIVFSPLSSASLLFHTDCKLSTTLMPKSDINSENLSSFSFVNLLRRAMSTKYLLISTALGTVYPLFISSFSFCQRGLLGFFINCINSSSIAWTHLSSNENDNTDAFDPDVLLCCSWRSCCCLIS